VTKTVVKLFKYRCYILGTRPEDGVWFTASCTKEAIEAFSKAFNVPTNRVVAMKNQLQ